MGHDSPRAAMIYQHATTVDDRVIAGRLSGLVDPHCAESEDTDEVAGPGEDVDADDGAAGMFVPVSTRDTPTT